VIGLASRVGANASDEREAVGREESDDSDERYGGDIAMGAFPKAAIPVGDRGDEGKIDL
jgi:hypothetical protein